MLEEGGWKRINIVKIKKPRLHLIIVQRVQGVYPHRRGARGYNYSLSSNSKCNTSSPEGLRCCQANEMLQTHECRRP
jgi:hypothetical protein